MGCSLFACAAARAFASSLERHGQPGADGKALLATDRCVVPRAQTSHPFYQKKKKKTNNGRSGTHSISSLGGHFAVVQVVDQGMGVSHDVVVGDTILEFAHSDEEVVSLMSHRWATKKPMAEKPHLRSMSPRFP